MGNSGICAVICFLYFSLSFIISKRGIYSRLCYWNDADISQSSQTQTGALEKIRISCVSALLSDFACWLNFTEKQIAEVTATAIKHFKHIFCLNSIIMVELLCKYWRNRYETA